MKIYLLIVVAVFSLLQSTAQNSEKKWALGLSYGTSQYAGDLKNDFLNFETYNLVNNGQLSLYLSRFL